MALVLQPKMWTVVCLRFCRLQQCLCWTSTLVAELTYTGVDASPSWTVCCVREGWRAELTPVVVILVDLLPARSTVRSSWFTCVHLTSLQPWFALWPTGIWHYVVW